MSWLTNLFRPSVSKLAPSGDQPVAALVSIGFGVTANARASHGVDWIVSRVANTNSMLPLIDANCVVLLERVPFGNLRTGDIVTYLGGGMSILHRLGERDRNGHFVVSGDNNSVNDHQRVTPANFDRRLCGILYGAKDAQTDN